MDLQASHIAANLPSDQDFMVFLQRDLRAYFASLGLTGATVEIELLRSGPTQSGVSYPKFYLWVRATAPRARRLQGAMRVEAIERKRFAVTDYVSAETIQRDPSGIQAIFPRSLIAAIERHARIG